MADIFRESFLTQKRESMLNGVRSITTLAQQWFSRRISETAFLYQMSQKSDELGAMLWLISGSGESIVLSEDQSERAIEDMMPKDVLNQMFAQAMSGKTVQYISVLKKDQQPYLLIATPLVFDSETSGVIFMNSNLTAMYISLQNIYRQIVLSSLLSASIVFVLVYLLSGYIVRDIRKITYAARQISKGNYKTRVSVSSNTEIGELAQTFNQMTEDIERLEALRTTFIANVSHELRTPMTSIQGFVAGMLDGTVDEGDKDMYLNTVLNETKRLNKLITDLLELSKVESGKFPLNIIPMDINELLCQCLITFENRIEDKKIEIEVDISEDKLMVNADPDRITQVLTNLIDNAVKFTPQNGRIVLSAHASLDDGRKIVVSIADSGEGIPESEKPYIFERFYKVDKSHSRNRGGYGIGLSIVKRIIAQHKEHIWIETVEGQGTTFLFTLQKQ